MQQRRGGFIPVAILLIIAAGLLVGGAGAYVATQNAPPKKAPVSGAPQAPALPSPSPAPVPHPPSSLSPTAPTTASRPTEEKARSSTPSPKMSPVATATLPLTAPLSPAETLIPPAVSLSNPSKGPVPVASKALPAPTSSLQVPLPPAPTSSPAAVTSTPALRSRTIAPDAIVGIVCEVIQTYTADTNDPQFAPVTEEGWSRGTGVLIDPRGYILTNKHVGGTYLQKATTTLGLQEITITITTKNKRCAAGGLPRDASLPTAAQIEAFNPTTRVPVLTYTVSPLYEPTGAGWSDLERRNGDFTVLKVTGLTPEAPIFGVPSLPKEFPYAPLLPTLGNLTAGIPVLSYGAPGDATAARNDEFNTIYILGAVGQVSKFVGGDLAFKNIPLELRIAMEVSGGRSGSPVFWNGYVVGIIQAHKSGDKTQTLAVASDAILKYLKETAGWEPTR